MRNYKESECVKVLPNPRFLEALEDAGYSSEQALDELVDNSIDGGAKRVDVHIQLTSCSDDHGSLYRISIVDNGRGINSDQIRQAATLGSKVSYGKNSLGKYGVGLKSAGTSLGKRFHILSKVKGGKPTHLTFDKEYMKSTNRWEAQLRPANAEESHLLSLLVGKSSSGTIVSIDGCQLNLPGKNLKEQKEFIMFHLGLVFRKFINKGVSIYCGFGSLKQCVLKKISSVDPLETKNRETYVYGNRTVTLNVNGVSGKISVRAVDLSTKDTLFRDSHLPPNRTTQGFYVMRNGRQISAGEMLYLKTAKSHGDHSEYNYFRCEVDYDSCLDSAFGLDSYKTSICPNAKVLAKVRQVTEDWLRQSQQKAIKRKSKVIGKNLQKNVISPFLKRLMEKGKKLRIPKGSGRTRFSLGEYYTTAPKKALFKAKNNGNGKQGSGGNSNTSQHDKTIDINDAQSAKFSQSNLTKTQRKNQQIPGDVEHTSRGEDAPLFDGYISGGTVVLVLNTDHPFYKVYIKGADTNPVTQGFLEFAWALVASYLEASSTKESAALVEEVIGHMSRNLNVLHS